MKRVSRNVDRGEKNNSVRVKMMTNQELLRELSGFLFANGRVQVQRSFLFLMATPFSVSDGNGISGEYSFSDSLVVLGWLVCCLWVGKLPFFRIRFFFRLDCCLAYPQFVLRRRRMTQEKKTGRIFLTVYYSFEKQSTWANPIFLLNKYLVKMIFFRLGFYCVGLAMACASTQCCFFFHFEAEQSHTVVVLTRSEVVPRKASGKGFLN